MSQTPDGILVSNKKEQIADINNSMDASRTAYANLKQPNIKAIYCINLFI